MSLFFLPLKMPNSFFFCLTFSLFLLSLSLPGTKKKDVDNMWKHKVRFCEILNWAWNYLWSSEGKKIFKETLTLACTCVVESKRKGMEREDTELFKMRLFGQHPVMPLSYILFIFSLLLFFVCCWLVALPCPALSQ